MSAPKVVPMTNRAAATPDRHANARERKRDRAFKSAAMRGDRSVFVIQDAIVKRGRMAKVGQP